MCPWLLLLLLLLPLQLHSAAHYNLLLQQLGDVCCLLVAVADNQRDSGLLGQQSVPARLSLQILMVFTAFSSLTSFLLPRVCASNVQSM